MDWRNPPATLYVVLPTAKFLRQYKKLARSGNYNMSLLDDVILMLANGEQLEAKYDPHPLHGNLDGYYGCHIKHNWVLVWTTYKDDDYGEVILSLYSTGTHADGYYY